MDRFKLAIVPVVFVMTLNGCKDVEWEKFTSPKCGFSVVMPVGVSRDSQFISSSFGEREAYMFDSEGPHNTYYLVQYSEIPDEMCVLNPEADLHSFVKGRVESLNGDILLYRRESLNGYPGREIKIQNEDGNYHFCRFYLVGKRLYVLSVFATRKNAASRDIERFFDSFKLL